MEKGYINGKMVILQWPNMMETIVKAENKDMENFNFNLVIYTKDIFVMEKEMDKDNYSIKMELVLQKDNGKTIN